MPKLKRSRAVLADTGMVAGLVSQASKGRAGLQAGGQAASAGGIMPGLAGKETRVG